jgi:hypothetical protein
MGRILGVVGGLTGAVLCSCASFEGVATGEHTYPPRPADHPIILYNDLQECSRRYEVIGVIKGSAPEGDSFAKVVEYMRREARKLGGDAIVFGLDERAGGSTSTSSSVGYARGSATATSYGSTAVARGHATGYGLAIGSSSISYEKVGSGYVLRYCEQQ